MQIQLIIIAIIMVVGPTNIDCKALKPTANTVIIPATPNNGTVPRQFIKGTTFYYAQWDYGGFQYYNWYQGGCFDYYGDKYCNLYQNYCHIPQFDDLCRRTCGLCSASNTYILLPREIPPGNEIVKAPSIVATIFLNDLAKKCTLCFEKTCPTTIPICVKVTIERSFDRDDKISSPSPSSIAVTAVNFNHEHYTLFRGPVTLGRGNDTKRTQYYVGLNMQCQAMYVFVNGTKGNDNIRVHDFSIFYGTCRNSPEKEIHHKIPIQKYKTNKITDDGMKNDQGSTLNEVQNNNELLDNKVKKNYYKHEDEEDFEKLFI